MKFGYYMDKNDWKELLEKLQDYGARLSYYPETDKDGFFVDYKYVIFEYHNIFCYMQSNDIVDETTITRYTKINQYEKQQCSYPQRIRSWEDIVDFLHTNCRLTPFRGTHKQRLYLTELYGIGNDGMTVKARMYRDAGFREREVLNHLDHIEMIMHTKDYCVIKYVSTDGDSFEFETKSQRITG